MNISLALTGQRINRIAVSAFFFISGFTFASWASRIPEIQSKLQLSDGALGSVLVALPVGLLTSLPLSGLLISKYGSRRILISAAFLYPFVLILLGMATATWQLVGALFFFGLFSNFLNISMNTQAVEVENMYGRSVMASFHGLFSLAGFFGAITGSFFVSAELSPLIHFSVIFILCGLIVMASFKNTLPDEEVKSSTKNKLFTIPDRNILLLGIIAFCSMICEGAMADWSGVYFKKVIVAPQQLLTLGYVAFTFTMAIGRFIGDRFITKFGAIKILQLSGALIATGLTLAIVFPNIITATAGFFLVGLGASSIVPMVYSISGKTKNMSTSVALATVSSIGFLGFLVGPPVIGFIAQLSGLRYSFILLAILGGSTAFLIKKVNIKMLS